MGEVVGSYIVGRAGSSRLGDGDRLLEILRNEICDNDHIAPDAIEFTVFHIRPNFAEPNASDQRAAGGILDEDA
jgi:hypothetical protein